jgi:class 3 adenylate cyclase/Tfp pilus assembly protein PilF
MAEKAFTKALSLNSDCAEAHYERGQLYEEMYDFEKAIKEYQRAVSVNPSMGKLYLSLGNLYRRLGKPHEAIECIEKAFVFFPEDAEAHTQIAEAYVAIRKYPEALNHYRKAVALNPKDIYAHYNMGIAFAQTGQYEEAMRAYTRALEINPEFVEPLYDLALACLQRGRLAEAEGYISLFLDKRPNNTFARFTLGSIYLRLEDLDRAIEEYTRAINSYPSHPYARFNLASGYARLGQYEKAEAEFREALDANPPKTEDEIILFATLASSQSIIQSLGKAMTELKRAFQLYEEATSRYQLEETVKNRIRGLFTRFVPETVVDRVIASDESVELEVRNVTVLFADIQGYSGLSEAESPRETMALLNEYYAHMAGIYRKYGGTLLYFQGDAQMIIFGAPVERPNHALLALRTAVDMRKEIGLIARKLSQQGRRSFEVGIGICKGEAVLGFINDGSRLQYTAIGDTVNTASRLQEVSKQHDYAIMVNEAVQREVKDFVDSERLEAVQLRGKAEPVTVYRILRLREEALRQDSPLYTLESAPSLAEITAPMPEAPVILAKVTAPSAGIAVPSAEISAPSAEIAVPSPEAPVISSPPVRPHLPPPMKPKALSGPTPPRGEAIEASD